MEKRPIVVIGALLHNPKNLILDEPMTGLDPKSSHDLKEILKQHSINGCNILERFKQRENEFYVYCYDICRYHHERYDGTGKAEKRTGQFTAAG